MPAGKGDHIVANCESRLWASSAAKIAQTVALFFPLLVLGTTESLALGTRAERAACTPDAVRLCSQHFPNVGRVTSCMRSNRASLSEACRSAMDQHDSSGRHHVADAGDGQATRSVRGHRHHRYEAAESETGLPRLRRHRGGFSMASMGQFMSMAQPYMGMMQPYMGMVEPYMGMITPYMGNLGGLGGFGGLGGLGGN
jgi:hypothetical protein